MSETVQPESANLWYLRSYWPYLLLSSLCILLYGITATYSFTPLDEYWLIIKERETLSSFSNIPAVFTEATTLGMYYRPMLTLTFMIDQIIGEGSTTAFHMDNIILFVTSILILFYFLQQIPLSRAFSFFAAMIFAAHPLNAHAVAWVPGRNDLILASFVMLSCIFLMKYLREGKTSQLGLHFIFFALSLLTKESGILLPFIFGGLWWMYSGNGKSSRVLLFTAGWISLVLGFYVLRASIVSFMPVVESTSFGERILDLFSTFFVYTGKIILPVNQSVLPLLENSNVWLCLAITLLVIAATLKIGVRNKKIAVLGVVWFCVLIAIPVWLGAANGQGECYEHRGYTPMIGFLILFSQLKVELKPQLLIGAALILCAAFIGKTAARLPVYADAFSYVYAGTKEAPGYGQMHDLLGVEYQKRNAFPEALSEHEQAIALDPGNADYISHRSEVLLVLGEYARAIADVNSALEKDRSITRLFLVRSRAHYQLGEYPQALADIDSASWLGLDVPVSYSDSVRQMVLLTNTK